MCNEKEKNKMHQLRDWLYIGNYIDLKSSEETDFKHIDSILNLAEDLPIKNKNVLFIDIDDGVPLSDENLIKGIEFLLNQYQKKKNVLVACGAGVSRSATFCTLIIKEVEGLNLLDSLKSIKEKYSKALPHPELWDSVCNAYQEPFKYDEVLNL